MKNRICKSFICVQNPSRKLSNMIGDGPPSKTIIFSLQTLQWQSYEFMNSSDSLLWKMQFVWQEHDIQVKFIFCEELNLIWAWSRNMSILQHLSTLNYSNKTQKNKDAQGCSRLLMAQLHQNVNSCTASTCGSSNLLGLWLERRMIISPSRSLQN